MPLPAVYESLARGQTQGMMIPWMITIPFKYAEVTKYHTDTKIYHSLLLTAMNMQFLEQAGCEPEESVRTEHRKILRQALRHALWDNAADPGRKIARNKGNEIIKLSAR